MHRNMVRIGNVVPAPPGSGASLCGDVWFQGSPYIVWTAGGVYYISAEVGVPESPAVVVGWSRGTLVGEYSPVAGSGMTGTPRIGWLRLLDSAGKYWTEDADLFNGAMSLEREDGAMTAWFDGSSSWFLSGTAGSTTGVHWTGDDMRGPYARVPQTIPATSPITLSDSGYVETTKKMDGVLIGQVVLWN